MDLPSFRFYLNLSANKGAKTTSSDLIKKNPIVFFSNTDAGIMDHSRLNKFVYNS